MKQVAMALARLPAEHLFSVRYAAIAPPPPHLHYTHEN
jgi:hypothetical protein